jgi:hypothetical protein
MSFDLVFTDADYDKLTDSDKAAFCESLQSLHPLDGDCSDLVYSPGSVKVVGVVLIPKSREGTSVADLSAELENGVLAAVQAQPSLRFAFGDELTVREGVSPTECPTKDGEKVVLAFAHSNGDACTVASCDTPFYFLNSEENVCRERTTAPEGADAQAVPALLQLLLPALVVVLTEAAVAY